MRIVRILKERIPPHVSPESYRMRADAFGIKVEEEKEEFVSFISERDIDPVTWGQILSIIFKPSKSSLS